MWAKFWISFGFFFLPYCILFSCKHCCAVIYVETKVLKKCCELFPKMFLARLGRPWIAGPQATPLNFHSSAAFIFTPCHRGLLRATDVVDWVVRLRLRGIRSQERRSWEQEVLRTFDVPTGWSIMHYVDMLVRLTMMQRMPMAGFQSLFSTTRLESTEREYVVSGLKWVKMRQVKHL